MTVQTIPIDIPEKLLPVLTSTARYIVVIGGRGSAKSESVSRIVIMKCQQEGSDLLCGREYQNSIDESVHKLNCEIIEKLEMPGSYVTEKKIDFASGGHVRYKGFARNSAAVKSAQSFKRSWVEEAQDTSADTLKDLLPTIRAFGSQLLFTANPQASNDPFSLRFIIPFKAHLDRHGIYEDDLHLIIVMNWRDNPWFPPSLEAERQWDLKNKSRAEYDHIWEGAFNDTVENSIIPAEWFDAAVDAHLKLGWKPRGAKSVIFDPSDSGDAKGLVAKHGNVILEAEEKTDGDVNDACDWATDKAIEIGADYFVWDGDGLGVSLRRQVKESFEGTKIDWIMFKGSEGPERPEEIYQPDATVDRRQARKNKDTFLNRRAQKYWSLRDRFQAVYRAVEKGEYVDPNEQISISSGIKCLRQLRSEVCRIPKKSNGRGLIQIMRKDEMKNQLKIASPNLADSVMMGETDPPVIQQKQQEDALYIPNMNRL